jgi:hypothetical protein
MNSTPALVRTALISDSVDASYDGLRWLQPPCANINETWRFNRRYPEGFRYGAASSQKSSALNPCPSGKKHSIPKRRFQIDSDFELWELPYCEWRKPLSNSRPYCFPAGPFSFQNSAAVQSPTKILVTAKDAVICGDSSRRATS